MEKKNPPPPTYSKDQQPTLWDFLLGLWSEQVRNEFESNDNKSVVILFV